MLRRSSIAVWRQGTAVVKRLRSEVVLMNLCIVVEVVSDALNQSWRV